MNWQLKPRAPQEFLEQFPEYSPNILQLLYERGLDTQEKIDQFFSPDYEKDLCDPFLMLDMKKAIKTVLKAVDKKKKFAIFGDYDADGVCGAVILKTVLEELGADLGDRVYIPNRMEEGYGLNKPAIEKLAQMGVEIFLTVDCGVSDFDEVALANSLGMEVVILDHHQIPKRLPEACAVVDPWQKKDKYPFKELCGAAVAFKFVQALIKENGQIKLGWEKWLLDLVALATVADCMPLLGENRTLVRYGLLVLAQTKRLGLRELMKIAKLDPVFEADSLSTNLDAYSLGFVLGPRLNAAGRVDHASLAFELLTAKDRNQAALLAKKVDEQNKQRQKMTEDTVKEIEERLKNKPGEDLVIVEKDKNWSSGVVGLVASKIADRHRRPAIVFREGETNSRGSARSLPAFNIVAAISQCADLIKEFGGHPAAAGLELPNENFDAFAKKINELAAGSLKEEDLVPVLEIDCHAQPEQVSWELFDELAKFEPFGKGNEAPVFWLENMEITDVRIVGNGSRHLKLELKAGTLGEKRFKAIGFGLAKNGNADLVVGDRVDVAAQMIVDEWNGNRNLQLKILDIKKSYEVGNLYGRGFARQSGPGGDRGGDLQ